MEKLPINPPSGEGPLIPELVDPNKPVIRESAYDKLPPEVLRRLLDREDLSEEDLQLLTQANEEVIAEENRQLRKAA
jgi:hypothetical protein